ncbi:MULTISPECIES: radical SAM protein [Streptomyces]|uniref:Radical SAM protein n=1 Tax=Streptomyces celluloflavus TaxID=58344 RepID=A0ABW7RND3_9ACTN|nr:MULTISPECIES: radical SAM protein [Streptomyces]MYU56703.1 radical SAM protein [Streptomyces sp. SID7805]WSK10358.1 radical SAM protein [Streptomyces celluloflavus]WSK17208.1 radical SAM protein [Streptomyces celluloflavus]
MTVVAPETGKQISAPAGIRSIELEITGTCQLTCNHCCTNSGPKAGPGDMTRKDWQQVIVDVAALAIPAVQMIGGEPTLSPHLPHYIAHALGLGLRVEVYSNLTHIRPAVWAALSRPGVTLATSYYSDQAEDHEKVTKNKGSHARTRANIIAALDRGIPLRVGIVEVHEGQRVKEAEAELRALGVRVISIDRARPIGRAADPAAGGPTTADLCGHCFRHRVSVDPDGNVSGCILSRFLIAGNVRQQRLTDILNSDRWDEMTAGIPMPRAACTPDDSSDCDPASTPACLPSYPVSTTLEATA